MRAGGLAVPGVKFGGDVTRSLSVRELNHSLNSSSSSSSSSCDFAQCMREEERTRRHSQHSCIFLVASCIIILRACLVASFSVPSACVAGGRHVVSLSISFVWQGFLLRAAFVVNISSKQTTAMHGRAKQDNFLS
mmetsp:Transcript_18181/g.50931  ORF Transcript_18181/g.50931 Transcript_18181/m.50931 type:complete len:135 (+) Transcript_18181:52-456(+)